MDYEEDGETPVEEASEEHMENLAEELGGETCEFLGKEVCESYDVDKQSRADWEQLFVKGIRLLGLKIEQATEPFKGACSAAHPILLENIVKFQSKAITELFPAGGPVKTQILGKAGERVEAQALRIKEFMNYELTEMMPEYFTETERMLFALALYGTAIKKNYYNPTLERPCNEYIPIDQFYVNNAAISVRDAERYTHVIYASHREYEADVASGFYRDAGLGEPAAVPERSVLKDAADRLLGAQNLGEEKNRQHTFLEQHGYFKLPDDKAAYPYVVTVDKETREVLQVRRCWKEGDNKRQRIEYFTKYSYVPSPFGFYDLGLVHLIGNLTMSITTVMRNLVDSGMFASMQGGFKSKTARIVGGDRVIRPGEFLDVEFAGNLKDNIMPISFGEPSAALFQMYQDMVGAGQRFADSQEGVIADSTNYGPVGTTLALLDASTKFFSAVHKRCHRSQREELKVIAALNARWLPDEYPYDVVGDSRKILKKDFDGRVDIIPVSDPNTPSQSQRLAKAQLVHQLTAQEAPGTVDRREVLKYILKVAEVPNYEKILIDPEADVQPRDPMTDIKAATLGQAVRAFPGQNHDSYITIFGAFVNDPSINTNQTYAPAIAILQAAIREHQLAKWLMQVESLTKVGMQKQPSAIPDQIMMQAAHMVMQTNQALAQQQEGTTAADMMAAKAAMMDSETRRMKIFADQIKAAADSAMRGRDADVRERKLEFDMAQAKAQFGVDTADMAIGHQKDLSLKATDLLMQDAQQQQQRAHEQSMTSMDHGLQREQMQHTSQESQAGREHEGMQSQADRQHQAGSEMMGHASDAAARAHEARLAGAGHAVDLTKGREERTFKGQEGAAQREHTSQESAAQREHDAQQAQRERSSSTKEGSAQREHDASQATAERRHTSGESSRQRQHDAAQKDAERKSKEKQAALKPKIPAGSPRKGK